MAVQIGPKIGIEGEKEYRSQISAIIAQTKQLDSAMDATAASWNANTSAMTKNKAVAQNLTQQISLYESKIAAMSALLEASKAKFGENATQTQRWQTAINDANASLAIMKQQLSGLGNAAEFSALSTKIADFGTKMQNIGQSWMAVGQKLTTSLTLPIAAVSAAAVNLASDMTEAGNKTDVVFGSMSQSVKDFASTTTDMYAISEGKALAMASDYGALATAMGFSDSEAAELATTMVGLAGDMASFHNKSIDVAANSLKGVFTGETEALKGLNVVMTQSVLDEYAAKQGKVYDSMSQTEKVMLRYNYLLENQSDAIGDAHRTMGEFAGSTRHLKAALEDAGAALGEAIIPIITPMINMLAKLAQWFSDLPKPIQKFIAVLLLIVAAVGPVILIIGALMSAFGSIITNAPIVASALTKVATALITTEIAGLPLLGFLGLLALAIAAGAAAGYLLAENWDSIAEAASNLGAGIVEAANKFLTFREALKEVGKGALDSLVAEFKELPKKVVKAIQDTITEVKQAFDQMIQNAKKSGKDFVEGFVDGIKEKVSKVVNAVKDIAKTIQDFLGFSCPDKGPLHEYETWMPDFMMGLAKGIRGSMGYVKGAVGDVAKTMALPLDSNAPMNMALAGAGANGSSYVGRTTMNVYVDHISELNDLLRIQNQAQQMLRMGAR